MRSTGNFTPRLRQSFVASIILAAVTPMPHPVLALDASITFAEVAVGERPADFEFPTTGPRGGGKWQVVADENAREGKALAQLALDKIEPRFRLAIYSPIQAADIEITVWFAAAGGSSTRSTGVIVRFADADNYYVAAVDALGNNVRFYRVVEGVHEQLGGADTRLPSGEYNGLTLRATKHAFKISLNGKLVLTTTDTTFSGPGKVGLWTRADSVTHFDWIVVRTLP